MKAVLKILVVAAFYLHAACAGEPARDHIRITVVGAVLNQGTMEVALGTPLEEVLDAASCHEGSYLKRVRVIRKIDGETTRLSVVPSDEERGKIAIFTLRDGDIVSVSEIFFDPDDAKKPKLVAGPFILEKAKMATNKETQQGG